MILHSHSSGIIREWTRTFFEDKTIVKDDLDMLIAQMLDPNPRRSLSLIYGV